MADPLTAEPEEALVDATLPTERAIKLLSRRDFRRTYTAVVISELGDAFQYVALMWFALVAAGPLGILAVRLADSVPALLFGLHGGVVADRHDHDCHRPRSRCGAPPGRGRGTHRAPAALDARGRRVRRRHGDELLRSGVRRPAADPRPATERPAGQRARAGIRRSGPRRRLGGRRRPARVHAPQRLLPVQRRVVLPVGASDRRRAGTEDRTRSGRDTSDPGGLRGPSASPRTRDRRRRPRSGRDDHFRDVDGGCSPTGAQDPLGAGSFSLVAGAYGVGAVVSGAVLSRTRVRHKVRLGLLLWTGYGAGFALFALAGSLLPALAASAIMGSIQASVIVLLYSAAQEEVPDAVLGRVVGLISLVHRGAHATGLLLIGPLFAVLATSSVFVAAAIAVPFVGLAGIAALRVAPARAGAAPARARR